MSKVPYELTQNPLPGFTALSVSPEQSPNEDRLVGNRKNFKRYVSREIVLRKSVLFKSVALLPGIWMHES